MVAEFCFRRWSCHGWEPLAVIEGEQVYFIRVDQIGRQVFATNAIGTKAWTTDCSPFGGVTTSTGTPVAIRFPGQWYRAESGLCQNWMQNYGPTTGRYLQADPLGFVDGASIYVYARQNPGRWTDPRGEFIPQAVACLVNPWRRAALEAAIGLIYGYLANDDACYNWDEVLFDAGLGEASTWGAGKAAAPIFKPTGLFRKGGWWSTGQNWRSVGGAMAVIEFSDGMIAGRDRAIGMMEDLYEFGE